MTIDLRPQYINPNQVGDKFAGPIYRPTNGLRFIERHRGDWSERILQQLWLCEDTAKPHAMTYEWRDVPTAHEESP